MSDNVLKTPLDLSGLSEAGRGIYDLMLSLVSVPSITASEGGENKCARFIFEWIAGLDYFKTHAGDLKLCELPSDPLGRKAVLALLRAERPTTKTVILTGHFDVVDVDVCGPLRQWAFDPEEYTRRIGALDLADEVRRDLESGDYIFGRGVSDMKAGMAINMRLLEDYASRRDKLDFNVLLLAVPDEEGDSFGMRGAIKPLVELRDQECLDYIVCINTEPSFESDLTPVIGYGTIGKIMPVYFCVGRETHVGDYYHGVNSTLIAAFLNAELDGDPATAETYGAQTFPPQCCLWMRDTRGRYAVTMPERSVLYYNCLTVATTPLDVLADMKRRALRALEHTLAHIGSALSPRVVTVEELFQKAVRAAGKDRDALVAALLPDIAVNDERERNIELLSALLDITGEKGPLVVVGFVPPYYPPRVNKNDTPRSRNVRTAAASLRDFMRERGLGFKEVEVFQGITDLSYTGFQGRAEELAPLAANTPLWGRPYELPLDVLRSIDIPPVLLGPMGRDSHKLTERLELKYSFNILPDAIRSFIACIVRLSEQ